MADIRPKNLILRCYGYRLKEGLYYGVCVDLNLAVEAESPKKLKKKMNDVIISYIDTVLDTNDKDSIPQLIYRRAPIQDWLLYYFIKMIVFIKQFPNNFTFNEYIPFHLSYNC